MVSDSGAPPLTVAELIRELVADDPGRRYVAAHHLANLERGSLAPAIGPLLATLESDPSAMTRNAAAWALFKANPLASSFLPQLLLLLKSDQADVRGWASSILARSAPGDPRVRPLLEVMASTDLDSETRWRAREALHDLGVTPVSDEGS